MTRRHNACASKGVAARNTVLHSRGVDVLSSFGVCTASLSCRPLFNGLPPPPPPPSSYRQQPSWRSRST